MSKQKPKLTIKEELDAKMKSYSELKRAVEELEQSLEKAIQAKIDQNNARGNLPDVDRAALIAAGELQRSLTKIKNEHVQVIDTYGSKPDEASQKSAIKHIDQYINACQKAAESQKKALSTTKEESALTKFLNKVFNIKSKVTVHSSLAADISEKYQKIKNIKEQLAEGREPEENFDTRPRR